MQAANRLTTRWAAAFENDGPIAYSGIGVWPLLGLLGAGADAQGRAELEAAFGLAADQVSDTVRGVVDLFDRNDGLSLAMGVWRRAEIAIDDDWLALLPPATRGELSGDARADQAMLDAWVSQHTNERLTRMPCDLNPSIQLLLASALTVDTEWLERLKPSSGRGVGAWAESNVPLLSREASPEDTWLARTPGGPLTVSLLEGSDDIDVYLMIGEEGRAAESVLADGLAALDTLTEHGIPLTEHDDGRVPGVPGVPGVSVQTVKSATGQPETRLECVAFKLSDEHDLLKQAEVFGFGSVSSPGGHFPGISKTPLRVDQARQDVVAEFSAEGFKAAAVTSIAVARAAFARPAEHEARRTTISYTRPHAFAAVHRTSGLVLVAGWVAKPGPAA
ncbi:MAG TPA: serpin family protein [Actinospica sp.]|nr:serpin family protein [Actinospica sp.]